MDSFNRTSFSQSYAPSAPTLPDSYAQDPLSPPTYNPHPQPQTTSYLQSTRTHTPPRYNGYQSYSSHSQQQQQQQQQQQPSYAQPPSGYPQTSSNYGYSSYSAPPPPNYSGYFPPGTHPEIIQSFQMVDKDRSGFIDERELQEALSFGYHKFSLGTVQLLMFLFRNPLESAKIGPNEFSALWKCLGEWRAIFERFDRDRSGKIDTMELRDALYSLGYAIPPSVLQVLISRYEDGSGRRGNLSFDNFVECGMIVKGLTEKFKEKDPRYTGSATLNYETFMSMVIPFIVT